jgi:hypothetical protein
MEESRDKLFSGSIGKIIAVFYNDTANTVSFKIGKFLDFDSNSILMLENGNNQATLIPRRKCIRIEIGGEAIAKAKIT